VKLLSRILRITITLLSLLLFLSTLYFWPCSYYMADGISFGRNGYSSYDGSLVRHIRGLRSSRGKLEIVRGEISSLLFPHISPAEEGVHVEHEDAPSATDPRLIDWSHLGFSKARFLNAAMDITVYAVPFWFLAPLFALLPTLWLAKVLRRRRWIAANRCPTCGYDMRATPDRCPECGNPAVTMPT
jgi:hypothetical protein